MNKIYKVIWNRVRHCYVVVSEIAKNHGKEHSTNLCVSKRLVALTLAIGLSLSSYAFAAEGTQGTDSQIKKVDLGNGAAVAYDNTKGNLTIGDKTTVAEGANKNGQNNTTIGTQTDTLRNVTEGDTKKDGQPLDGSNTKLVDGEGKAHPLDLSTEAGGSTAVGYKNHNEGDRSTTIGNNAKITNKPVTYYVDKDGNKTASADNAAWYKDASGNPTKVPQVFRDADGNKTNTPQYVHTYTEKDPDTKEDVTKTEITSEAAKADQKDGQPVYNYQPSDNTSHLYTVTLYQAASNSIAAGTNVTANGSNAVAVGYNSTADNSAVAIGDTATATGDNTIAIGTGSTATDTDGTGSIAIGKDVKADKTSTAVGLNGTKASSGSSAYGNNAVAENSSSAFGSGVQASGGSYASGMAGTKYEEGHSVPVPITATNGSYATGMGGTSANYGGMAVGNNVSATNNSYATGMGGTSANSGGMAVGNNVSATNGSYATGMGGTKATNGSMAVGNNVSAGKNGGGAFAVGMGGTTADNSSMAVGDNVQATGSAFASGRNGTSAENGGIAYGDNVHAQYGGFAAGTNKTSASSGVAVGSNVHAYDGSSYAGGMNGTTAGNGSIAFGNNVHAGTSGSGGAFAAGMNGTTADGNSVAVGDNVHAAGGSYAAGMGGTSASSSSVAIGNNAYATSGSTAIGSRTKAESNNSLALGDLAEAHVAGGVALGQHSTVYRGATAGLDPRNGQPSENTTPTWKSTYGALSIGAVDSDGNVTGTRQIIGVAAGTNDTDAVNVAQLKQVAQGFSIHDYSVSSTTTAADTNYNNGGAQGSNALAAGVSAKATGASAVAVGSGAQASENYSVAIGNGAQANKTGAIALGNNAIATGIGAMVIGQYNTAEGQNSLAFGGGYNDANKGNKASSTAAVAFGEGSWAMSEGSVAFGYGTQAGNMIKDKNNVKYTGQNAVAFGNGTKALGGRSLAFGENTTANYNDSVAFGNDTRALSTGATAFGNRTRALSQYATAWGNATVAADAESTAWGTDTIAGAKLDDNGAVTNIYTYKDNPDDKNEQEKTATEKMDVHGNLAYLRADGTTAGIKQMDIGGKTEKHDYVVLAGKDGNTYVRDYQGSLWKVNVAADGRVTVDTTAGKNGKVYNVNDKKKPSLATTTVNGTKVDITPDNVLTKAHEGSNGYNIDGYANATAFGYSTEASGDNATAFGNDTKAKAAAATAFGKTTTASGDNATAFGLSTTAYGKQANAFGSSTTASGDNATAFGENSTASGEAATAFGIGSTASGKNSLAGLGGTASNENSIALGKDTKADNADSAVSVAIGQNAEASGAQSLAIGFGNVSETNQSGNTPYPVSATQASAKGAIAIGINTGAKGEHSIAMGSYTDAAKDSSVAIGFDTHAVEDSSVAIGSGTKAAGRYSVALGLSSIAGTETNDEKNPLDGGGSVAMGYAASAEASRSIAIGTGATAADSQFTTAVGDSTTAQAEGSVAIGAGSIATRGAGNKESIVSTDINTGKTTITYGDEKKAYLKPDTLSTDKISTWGSTTGAVSVGGQATYKEYDDNGTLVKKTKLLTRQITNVAAGSDDTDAVNVAQLKAAQPTVTSNDHSVTIATSTDLTDYHKNYDLKIATATLSQAKTGTGDSAVETGKVTVTNPKISVIENGETKQVDNPNAYVTGNSVADAINNSGFKLTASASEGTVTGNKKILIHPGDTVTIDAGKNISLTQDKGKISIATKDNLNLGSADSKDDKQQDVPGTNGSITVNGQNGSSVAINGQDGSIGLTGPKGTDGTSTSIQMSTIMSDPTLDDGKNTKTTSGEGEQQTNTTQAPRIQYKNGNTTYEVATMDDGQKYAGDVQAIDAKANAFSRKLNERTNIIGGVKNLDALSTGNNVGVVSNGTDTLTIRLAKELTDLTSVTTVTKDAKGNKTSETVQDGNGITITPTTLGEGKPSVSLTDKGLSNGGNQITHVASGLKDADGKTVELKDATGDVLHNAVNVEDLKNVQNVASAHTAVTVNGSVEAPAGAADGKLGNYTDKEKGNLLLAQKKATTTGKITYDLKLNDNVILGKDTSDVKDGQEGTIGLTGKDGLPGTDGKQGYRTTIIKTEKGQKGKDGKTGKENLGGTDINRIVYTDKDGSNPQTVATLSDGLKFMGNDGQEVSKKLNETLSIKGGLDKDAVASASTKNLGVRSNKAGDGLEIVMTDTPDFTKVTVGEGTDPNSKITIGKQTVTGTKPDGSKSETSQTGNYITGLDNKAWDKNNVVADRAATEGQLKDAINEISGKDKGGFGLADENGTTVKKDLGQTITVKGDTVYAAGGKTVVKDGNIKTAVNDDAIQISLNDQISIGQKGEQGEQGQPGTPGKDGKFTVETSKGTTVVIGHDGEPGQDGKDGISVKGKDGKDGVTISVTNGKDGKDGSEGHIGLTGPAGKDGKDASADIHVKNGRVGVDGTDGNKGTNGMDRVVYEDHNHITHEVATMDDGLKFVGDDGTAAPVTKKLNDTLQIRGDGTYDATTHKTNDDGNIKISSDAANGTIKVALNDKINLHQAGALTVGGNKNGDAANGQDPIVIKHFDDKTLDVIGVDKDGKPTTSKEGKAGDYVTGLDNKDWNVDSPTYVSGRAATEDQLKKVNDAVNSAAATAGKHTVVTVNDKDSNETKAEAGTGAFGNYAGADKGNLLIAAKNDNGQMTYNIKLNDQLAIGQKDTDGHDGQPGTAGKDGKVTVETRGGTTVVIGHDGEPGKDGKDGLFVTGKDGADGVSITGPNGADGVDGKVGIAGTDGKDAVSISGKDGVGHIGLTGPKGEPGKNGISIDISTKLGQSTLDPTKNEQSKAQDKVDSADKASRIQYESTVTAEDGTTKTITHEVATMDDGLKFVGNDGKEVTRKLNSTLSITGGMDKDAVTTASSKNLGVRSNKDGDGLEIVMTDTPDFTKVTVGEGTDPNSKITIGKQTVTGKKSDGTAGTAETGKYITGLDNTKWNKDNVVENRAATEGQLRDIAGAITNQNQGGGFALTSDEKGDDKIVKQDLGKAIQIKGDTTYKADGSVEKAGNIKTSIDNGAIKVELNKNVDLGNDGSVKAGKTTINQDGVDTNKVTIKDSSISISKEGINGGSKQITNVASGASEIIKGEGGKDVYKYDNDTNAANIGDVKRIAGDMKTEINNNISNVTNKVDQIGQHVDNIQKDVTQLKTDVKADRTYQGDDGAAKKVKVKFGSFLSLTGGAKLADLTEEGNIGVVQKEIEDPDHKGEKIAGLSVRLAKHLNLEKTTYTSNENGQTYTSEIDGKGLTIKTGDENRNITVQDGNVNMGGNQIHNVAPGQAPGDAVNVSQLNATNYAVNKLGTRVNRVGAGAAALAALHPLDFDPDDKWDFAAGYGNYKDASAVAVGAYYRPNEDTMFNIGGSFGGGENMVNAGVSFKVGQGNHVSTSRVAMAKEIKDLRQNVANLNAIVNRQSALIDKLTGTNAGMIKDKGNDLFPDVPANHWAYEYVTKLKQAGILTGYPDGNFDGDRMMTRYEFAAIVYRAIMAGAASNPALNQDGTLDKLANEFSSEMKYIRIDTIAKDKNGKPTIERVRVIPDTQHDVQS